MSTEDNKALIRRFYEEVFNSRNLTALDEFYALDHKKSGQEAPRL
jgi:hypothetical protein